MSEGGSSAFAVAQQIGKSLFLPIAVLPFAGVLLGIGASFSNPTTIAAYGLEAALHHSFKRRRSNLWQLAFDFRIGGCTRHGEERKRYRRFGRSNFLFGSLNNNSRFLGS